MVVQITSAQEQRLTHLATESHRSLDDLAQESIDRYLAYEEDIRAAVIRGREDVAAGRLLDHEQVLAHINTLLTRP